MVRIIQDFLWSRCRASYHGVAYYYNSLKLLLLLNGISTPPPPPCPCPWPPWGVSLPLGPASGVFPGVRTLTCGGLSTKLALILRSLSLRLLAARARLEVMAATKRGMHSCTNRDGPVRHSTVSLRSSCRVVKYNAVQVTEQKLTQLNIVPYIIILILINFSLN